MTQEDTEIKITILCFTYNQEPYIKQCLDSLVNQKTSFRYRVIVHDDASTDQTTRIIMDYADRYPDLIVPIIQKENLYSRGINQYPYIAPKIKGNYLAYCEGDDWWLSENKLQIQYDYMEKNEDCSLCVHDAKLYGENEKLFLGYLPSSGPDRDIGVEEIIENGGWYLGTNTMLFRAEYLDLPDIFSGWGVGDYPRAIYLAMQGRVHFISGAMAAHRVGALGSWTKKMSEDIDLREEANERIISGLRKVDVSTNYKYHDSFEKAEFMLLKQTVELRRDLGRLLFGDYSSRFWRLGASEIVKSILRCVLPKQWIQAVKQISRRQK